MKLARIAKPLRSVQLRVMLSGGLNASLERYARYYEHVHRELVDTRALIPEILHAFIDADREFQSWSRSSGRNGVAPRAPAPSSSHGSIRVERRLASAESRLTCFARVYN
jgi:hypothetical protein